METAENSQEKSWASGATSTVHAAGRNGLSSDPKPRTDRKTNRMFGINGGDANHDHVNENCVGTPAKRTVAQVPPVTVRFTVSAN